MINNILSKADSNIILSKKADIDKYLIEHTASHLKEIIDSHLIKTNDYLYHEFVNKIVESFIIPLTTNGVQLCYTIDYFFIHTLKVGVYKGKLIDLSKTNVPDKLHEDDIYYHELLYRDNDFRIYDIREMYSPLLYLQRNDKAFHNFYHSVYNNILLGT